MHKFGRLDYIKITLLGFAITAMWQALHTIILPLRLLDFTPEADKNTALGIITFIGLVLAMLVQPVAGAMSDRSGHAWGRRRPFVLLGGGLAVLFLPGFATFTGFAAILTVYCLLQISTNIAQGPFQGLIPDIVPGHRRGRASGVKTMLEIVGGAIAVYVIGQLMGHYEAGEGSSWLWLSLGIIMLVMAVTVAYTMLAVREKKIESGPKISPLEVIRRTFGLNLRANRPFAWFLASRLLVFMAFTTIQQFALYYLRDVIGVDDPPAATANFTIVAVAGMLAAVYPAGYFSDRIGRKPIAAASGLLAAFGVAVIFLSHDYTSILVAAGILGVAIGAFNSTNWALATDLVAKGEEARYLGLANVATAGGAALARLIGPVIDFFNKTGPGLGYQVMLAASFFYFIAGALLVLKIKGHR